MISEVAALLSSPPLSTRWTDSSIEETPSWPGHWSRIRWWRRCVWVGKNDNVDESLLFSSTRLPSSGWGRLHTKLLRALVMNNVTLWKKKTLPRIMTEFFLTNSLEFPPHWELGYFQRLAVFNYHLLKCFTENLGISKGLLSFITTYHCIIVWIYES